jgi:hypothetical protein
VVPVVVAGVVVVVVGFGVFPVLKKNYFSKTEPIK